MTAPGGQDAHLTLMHAHPALGTLKAVHPLHVQAEQPLIEWTPYRSAVAVIQLPSVIVHWLLT